MGPFSSSSRLFSAALLLLLMHTACAQTTASTDATTNMNSTEALEELLTTILTSESEVDLTTTLSSSPPMRVTKRPSPTAATRRARTTTTELATMIPETTTKSILQKWQAMEKSLKNITGGIVKRIIASVVRGERRDVQISPACIGQVMKLLAGLKDIKPWAFSFFDASGKFIDGMLSGTMANLGEYDQCLNIQAIEERRRNKGKVLFTGKYCALDLRPPLPPKKHFYKFTDIPEELRNFSKGGTVVSEGAKFAQLFHLIPMRIGICVPSGCMKSDISKFTSTISNVSGMGIEVRRCEVKEEKQVTPTMIAIMTVFSFFGLLMLLGTVIDIYGHYAKRTFTKIPIQVLLAFSFMTNFKKLVNTDNASGPFSCFSGLRVLSMTWIILGHTYLNINFQLFRGLRYVIDFPKDFAFQAVINATVAVDTFFLMGGVLVCYLTIKFVKELKKPFNIGLYIFHRIFRIMPIYSSCIAFMFLAPLMGYGPVWHDTVDYFLEGCYKNWWSNLIFINNFYNTENMCLPQSWYIACDVQLYIAALIILLPLFRWPRVGLSIAGIGILASMIAAGAITYAYSYPPTMLFVHPDHDQRISMWATSYFKPYSHAGPYCVGMILGYILATRPSIRLPLRTRVIGWCMATACNMAVLYGVWEWNSGRDAALAETLIYSSFHRVAWALGVSWVIFSCATGQGGVVNYILTWRAWTVLGRLTYGAYLIHPMVQIAAVGNARMKLQAWHYFGMWMFSGHLLVTYGCAFCATMLVEAPFLALEKIMFRKQIAEVRKEMEKNAGPDVVEHPGIENGSATKIANGNTFEPRLVPRKTEDDDEKFTCRL